MTEDRDKWKKYDHGVANPRIEDGYRTEQLTASVDSLHSVYLANTSSSYVQQQDWLILCPVVTLVHIGLLLAKSFADTAIYNASISSAHFCNIYVAPLQPRCPRL